MPKAKGSPKSGGRLKGTPNVATISKELAREEARKLIQGYLPRIFSAQAEAACGVAHLMLRNEDGTWSKAPAKMTADEMLVILNGDPSRYYISLKDPNTQAASLLAAYALDKPKEQVVDVNLNVTELGQRLDAARLVAAARNKK